MSMSREEIDLREKIGNEIQAFIDTRYDKANDREYQEGLSRAIGIVRDAIWHGSNCPCSKCQRFEIKSCSHICGNHRRILADEVQHLQEAFAHEEGTLFYCSYCRSGQNEYDDLSVMLFDKINEYAVTPCCHTEATEALKCYCAEGLCPDDDDSMERQERLDYVWSQR
jgi:hypothetical protein